MEPKRSFRRFLFSKPVLISLAIIACLCIGITVYGFINGAKAAREPEYETTLPKGKEIRDLGGWKRISPPENEPVFAYTDRIDSVPISVSQQALPPDFKSNTAGKVAELAQKFNATTKLEAGDTIFYIGTSSKGPQSVIFAKKEALILIKSEKKILDASWTRYVGSLE